MKCSRLLSAAALLASTSMPALASEIDEVFFEVRPSMVQLVGVGVDGRYSLGSGVALPDGKIVTNCHVTLRSKRVEPSSSSVTGISSQIAASLRQAAESFGATVTIWT